MRLAFILFSVLFMAVIISCSNCKPTNETVGQDKIKTETNPTAIVQNISLVTARVDKVLFKSETDYQIKVTVLVVEQHDDKQSIATPGEEYLLIPNFRYDNNKLMDSDINESLKKLSKLTKGKEFKAEISLENEKGWFIQKVIIID
jgi:hypothetical protein